MSFAVGTLNVFIGVVYFAVGAMTLVELVRNWSRMGFSLFGTAWIAMLFTCGPHHFVHGEHMLLRGQAGGVLDLVAAAVSLPAGLIWFYLRLEAFRGGRGDRFVAGTPAWVAALPLAGGAYAGGLAMAIALLPGAAIANLPAAAANLILTAAYLTVGYLLARTQVANRRPLGGWSVSGLTLTISFVACASMHAVFAAYTLTGAYAADWHTGLIGWLAVPASAYFLWVVQALWRGTYRDWNQTGRVVPAAVGG